MSKKVENFIREEVEGIKSGARVTRTRIVKEMKDFDGFVLNGIAWDSKGKRLFVTGKKWDKLFQIKLGQLQ